MTTFLAYTIVGIATGCIYALTASGLVVTYTTSGIFNFAHGAIGMVMAFTFWELTVKDGWPQWLALIVVLGLFAPLLGYLIDRLLMRNLHGASTSTQIVMTLGLLLLLIGVATVRWNPGEARVLPEFFIGHHIRLFTINVTYHQLTMIAVAVLVAAFLRLLFTRTQIGIAMRAVVDDPELASLTGADPDRVRAVSWALGASLAGLAGILLAPLVSLDIILLTLLVINGYAAAMVGRLKSLPLTFVGGLALGLAETYAIWKLPTGLLNKIRPSLPIIFLYLVLLVLPQAKLRAGRAVSLRRPPRVAGLGESIIGGVALVGVAALIAPHMSRSDLTLAGQGMVFALIMLSLVLLTGYAGQTSLAQMTFVGIGAFAMGKYFGGASLLGILLAAVLAGAIGAVAALPALRLQGLYLALSTLAFAEAMSTMFFKNAAVFGYGGRLAVGRPSVLGVSFHGDHAYFLLITGVFALAGIGVLALRRGKFGRKLVAMKDSPAACATLGIDLTFTKLAVFALSASLAGVAGVFFGGLRGQVGPNDFEMLQSLVLLLLVTISGISSVTGALMGGLTFGLIPRLQQTFKSVRSLTYIGPGLGILGVGRNPYGYTSEFAPLGARIRRRFGRGAEPPAGPAGDGSAASANLEEVDDLVGVAG
ncbi:MAG: livH 4 [Acidimicrobiales bacterium]|nr:livH 4 [Acidimicrobiales bacterium]